MAFQAQEVPVLVCLAFFKKQELFFCLIGRHTNSYTHTKTQRERESWELIPVFLCGWKGHKSLSPGLLPSRVHRHRKLEFGVRTETQALSCGHLSGILVARPNSHSERVLCLKNYVFERQDKREKAWACICWFTFQMTTRSVGWSQKPRTSIWSHL